MCIFGFRIISILALLLTSTSCADYFEREAGPETYKRKVAVQNTLFTEKHDFKFDVTTDGFISRNGVNFEAFVEDRAGGRAGSIRVVSFSHRAYARVQSVKRGLSNVEPELIAEHRPKPEQISAGTELQVIITQAGFRFESCTAQFDIIALGCATEINRALSLVSPREMTFGRRLAAPSGAYEERVLQHYQQRNRVPLLGVEK